jgi:hypothetical protein
MTDFKPDLHIDGDLVNCENFPLPNLSLILRKLATELYNGKGFFLLRGLDFDKYTVEDNTVIFLGIQSFIAERRACQDNIGNMMGDQVNLRKLRVRIDKMRSTYHRRFDRFISTPSKVPYQTFQVQNGLC